MSQLRTRPDDAEREIHSGSRERPPNQSANMAAAPASHPWFALANVHEVPSPALLVYPDRVEENVRRMIALVGGTARLRPHMKTHKMAEVIRLQVARGIRKFKCATLAE